MQGVMQNDDNEALVKKAKNIRWFFSLAMGILCFIALLFPLFIFKFYETILENGFTLMFFNSKLLAGNFLFIGVILGLLCWLQFFISIAIIIISILAIFKFSKLVAIFKLSNKAINIITLILPIVAMGSIFIYMLQGSITSAISSVAVGDIETATLSFIPFILAIPVLIAGFYLRNKYKVPVEKKGYQQALKFGMENDILNNNVAMNNNDNVNNNGNLSNNENITDTANASSDADCVSKNYDKLLSESQIQGYLMSIKNNIPNESLYLLNQQLHKVPQSKMSQLAYLPMKNPTTILLMSIFLGGFGVDRFMLGDMGLGVCKLLFGVFTFGIWPIIDIFMCYKKVKEKNLEDIMLCITYNHNGAF